MNNIHQKALEEVATGVKICANVVRSTMGAAGRNVILEEEFFPGKQITNDGATIISKLQFTDPLHRIGHSFVLEATERSNQNSGDGSTTTTVLLDAILQEGINSGVSTLEIKKSLDELIPVIEEKIDAQKREITVDDVEAVATIAGESRELGKTLGEIYRVIGKEGIIHLEGSGTFSTSYSLIEGVRFGGTGYLSPYMVHDEQAKKEGRKETKAVYENPTILVTKRKIAHLNDINPLLKTLEAQNKKDLVIFTDDMDSGVAAIMVEAHKTGVLNLLIIKAPVLWKNYVFEDFAKITGSTIVEDASGVTFKNLQVGHLGTCDKLIVDKDECTVIGIADITDHVMELQEEANAGNNDANLRLSWLTTKTAILKLGANSETELSYLRLKAEDAIHASRAALADGIVAGGGVALLNVSNLMPSSVGGRILRKALEAPARQIRENAGLQPINYLYGGTDVMGLDAATGEDVNMFAEGIIDAARVVKMAVRNAIGVASTILTSDSVITLPEKTASQIAQEALQSKGLRF